MRVLAVVWAVALAASALLAYRLATLPPKGAAAPMDESGRPLLVATAPGVPPDPGTGPQLACWVIPGYVEPPGVTCPPRPAPQRRP